MNRRDYEMRIVGTDATKAAFRSIEKNVGRLRAGLNSSGLKVATGVGVAAMTALTASQLQVIDSQAKLSDRFQITIGDIAAYQRITTLSGESSEDFDKALTKMIRTVGNAERGLGLGAKALENLGINQQEFFKLNPGEQFRQLSVAISSLESPQLRASIASDLFGRAGADLVNTMQATASSFADVRQEVTDLGLDVSRLDAAKVEAANDAIFTAQQKIQGIGTQLAVQFAPLIAEVADRFVEFAGSGEDMAERIGKGFQFLTKTGGVFADGLRGVQVILKGAELGFEGLQFVSLNVYRLLINGAIDVGQAIIDGVTLPLRGVLEVGALVSDTGKDLLAGFKELTTLDRPEKFLNALDDELTRLAGATLETREELQSLLLSRLPSEAMRQAVEEVFTEAERRAAEISQRVSVASAGGGAQVVGLPNSQSEEDKQREQLEKRLAVLEEGYLSELQLLQVKLGEETRLIQDAVLAQELTREQAAEKTNRAAARFAQERIALEKRTTKQQEKNLLTSFGRVTGAADQNSKKLFKISQGLSLAQTVAALPSAIIKSFENGGGYPWGLIPAAAMALEGARQISNIKSANIGSGSAPSVNGGGGGSVSTPQIPQITPSIDSALNRPAANQPQIIIVNQINGSVVTNEGEYFNEKIRAYTAQSGDRQIDPASEEYAAIAEDILARIGRAA